MDSPLILKPKQFALDIIKACNFVTRVLGKRVLAGIAYRKRIL